MKISEQYYILKDLFDLQKDKIEIPGSRTVIYNFSFSSPEKIYGSANFSNDGFPAPEDGSVSENLSFRYPVFVPAEGQKYKSFILLLHGLNERSWSKHLSWAKYLCESTGQPVVMFPSSFHMNRSMPGWTDRNEISTGLAVRHAQYPKLVESSVANLVLSQRLTEVPQRFFLSGFQSALDITNLLNDIQAGNHTLFEKDSTFNVFSYSIGIFLAECMMIANPGNIFDNSKFVFFAGGSLFEEMNGVSKYIMDDEAFRRLFHYHMKEIDDDMKENPSMGYVLSDTAMGKAFRSMISYNSLRNLREKALRKYKNRILSITLASDKVIPAVPSIKFLSETVCSPKKIKIMDFKFPCIHENPFPVNLKEYTTLIDEAFLKVFSLSGSFLAV